MFSILYGLSFPSTFAVFLGESDCIRYLVRLAIKTYRNLTFQFNTRFQSSTILAGKFEIKRFASNLCEAFAAYRRRGRAKGENYFVIRKTIHNLVYAKLFTFVYFILVHMACLCLIFLRILGSAGFLFSRCKYLKWILPRLMLPFIF